MRNYMDSERGIETDKSRKALEMKERLVSLRKVFERLAQSSYEGIPGIIKIESGKPGPTFGMTVCTHGGEPSGLAAAEYVLDEVDKKGVFLAGTISIVLANVEAAKNYFNAQTKRERQLARFVDVNLNRIPPGALEDKNDTRYEIQRMRELQPVLDLFEIGLDVHSTTQKPAPMVIPIDSPLPVDLLRGMPIQKVLSNYHSIVGEPIAHFFGTRDAPAQKIAIEVGSHESPEAFDLAVTCTRVLLENLGMLSLTPRAEHSVYEMYDVWKPVIFPNTSYSLTRVFKNFSLIRKGTVIATGNGPDIIAEENCHPVMASKKKPDSIAEEVMFLTRPVRRITLGSGQSVQLGSGTTGVI